MFSACAAPPKALAAYCKQGKSFCSCVRRQRPSPGARRRGEDFFAVRRAVYRRGGVSPPVMCRDMRGQWAAADKMEDVCYPAPLRLTCAERERSAPVSRTPRCYAAQVSKGHASWGSGEFCGRACATPVSSGRAKSPLISALAEIGFLGHFLAEWQRSGIMHRASAP